MAQRDDRLIQAKAIPIAEVAERLGLALKPIGAGEIAGPCPIHGGRRDRLSIQTGKGVFLCRGDNEGGDAIALVSHVLGCDFKAALDWLVGEAQPDPAARDRLRRQAEARQKDQEAETARRRQKAIDAAIKTWRSAKGFESAYPARYLARRGIALPEGWVPPQSIRFRPRHQQWVSVDGKRVNTHTGPCMIAAIQGPDDRLRGVHQTWLDLDQPKGKAVITYQGEAMKAKLVRGSMRGGAIRLITPPGGDTLVMGEGIETTLSVWSVLRSDPDKASWAYWAGVSLGHMAGKARRVPGQRHSDQPDLTDDHAFVAPPWVKRLIFLLDGDSDPPPTRAKLLRGLRRSMALRPGLEGFIVAAPEGKDFNDMLAGQVAS